MDWSHLEKLKETSYDFIFMDIQMPEMDGYTAMKHIREEMPEVLKSAMIIGLSANASEDERDKCMASGMHEYLSKPFNPGDLIRVIMKVKKKSFSSGIVKSETDLKFLISSDSEKSNLFLSSLPPHSIPPPIY
jgi:DNA-binding response OmpR family regulator